MEDYKLDEGDRGGLHIVVTTVAVIALTVLYIAYALLIRRKGYASRLPPGPRGWPVVGSLLSLGKLPHITFTELSKQYGPLLFLRLGSVPTLVVSSPDMAKEILKTHDQVMASRPSHILTNILSYGRKDIAFAPYGLHWRRVRKICALELFTASRIDQFEGARHGESLAVLQDILEASAQGNALNMKETLSKLTLNIMTQMLWNKSEYSAQGSVFMDILHESFDLSGAVNIGDFIPVLKPLNVQGFDQRAKNVHERMDVFIQTIIDEHRKKESSIAAEDPNVKEDFVDVLLKLSKQAESEPLSIDVETVKGILQDMITAGTETTANTIEWGLAELVKHPGVISRAQEELDSVVGRDRLVNEADVSNLNYMQAVVKETFRLHPAGPLNVPHKSTHECEIAGYHVPANTLVFVNSWAIQRDAALWERPLEFDPDRFLDSKVDVKGMDFELIPFGSGRRICPGMNLALVEVHLSLARLLHAFDWSLPPYQKVVDLDMTEGAGLSGPKEVPLIVLAKSRLPTHVIDPAFP